jgi:hypothetical protein
MEETMIKQHQQQKQTMLDDERDNRNSQNTDDHHHHDHHHHNDDTKDDRFLPLTRADSEEFFLPFDYEEEITVIREEEEPSPSSAVVATAATKINDQQQQQPPAVDQKIQQPPPSPSSPRQRAVSLLESFFMGELSSSSSSSTSPHIAANNSPVSAIEIDRALTWEQKLLQQPLQPLKRSDSSIHGNESLSSVLEEEPAKVDDGSSLNTDPPPPHHHHHNNTFTRLNKFDRTTSLPLDLSWTSSPSRSVMMNNGTNHPITRRSSLKKVSSYGLIPPNPKASLSSSPLSSSTNSLLKRNVSFGSMRIREYNVALSDHPSCSYGPPVQLSWDYQEKDEVPVDSYEEARKGNRRRGHHLLLSFYERHVLLIKEAGYSKREIKETMKEVERVKRERMVTDLFLPASPLDETMEHVMDTVKKFFHRPKQDDDYHDHVHHHLASSSSSSPRPLLREGVV